MIVGVPTEVKDRESRVSTTPGGVAEFVARGHRVLVEAGAGEGSGFADDAYARAGAELVPSHAEVFDQADMIVKVKEPIAGRILPAQREPAPVHLPASRGERAADSRLMDGKVQSVGYETVQLANRLAAAADADERSRRPHVGPGRRALPAAHEGGHGVLLGGVPGVAPANVVIIGGGIVGTNAAQIALGHGAQVTIVDRISTGCASSI